MAESVARRDRIDSQTLTSWYLWEAPQQPACVYIAFDVIDRLENEVVENFRSLTSRGSEVGGILLGGVVSGTPTGVYIADFAAVTCDYSRGPLYRLSDTDLSRFERAVEQHSSGNVQVVGFFRSHTRKGLVLDPEDLAFLDARFRNPHSLALLVRPFATKASVGGLFLRGENGFNGEVSPLEFPFRSSQLTPSKKGPESSQPAPAARAQVVPIAPRRDVSTPPPAPAAATPAPAPAAPAPAPAPSAQPAAQGVEAKLAPSPSAAPTAAPKPETKAPAAAAPASAPAPPPAAAKAPAPPQQEKEKEKEKEASPAKAQQPATAPVESKVTARAPEPVTDVVKEEAKRPSKVPMLTGILAAAILVFVLLFVYPGFLHHTTHTTAGTNQDSSPLSLRVEHTGTDVLLTWNRDSAAIMNASRATLSITDGDRHENYDMDMAQLRTGSIVYSPLGGDVSFRMEVIGKDQSRTTTETLRMLRTPRPSPMPDEQDTKNAKSSAPTPAQPAPSNTPQNTPAPTTPATSDASPVEPAKPANQPKPFDASSLSQRLRPARAADLGDIPSPAAGGLVAPRVDASGSLPFASLPAAPAPAAPRAAAPAPASSRPAPVQAAEKANLPAGGQIQPAQLISRKEPDYPLLARQMGAKGTVELIATIGTDGAVKSVKVIKGHPLLVNAAKEAVMQWRYRPTLLNGQPVTNDTRITLNFQ